MTKTEYRKYIASEEWQERRRKFLKFIHECDNCGLLRHLAIIAYDQDLHVHHKSYQNLGSEADSDLQPLCRRCHEIKTFGSSNLHKPQEFECKNCGNRTWNSVNRTCEECNAMLSFVIGEIDRRHLRNKTLCPNGEPWEWIISVIASEAHRGSFYEFITKELEKEARERAANLDSYDESNE